MDSAQLEGNLSLLEDATWVALFAHGSDSSRHSPLNRSVAQALHEGGLGTLLIDLRSAKIRAPAGYGSISGCWPGAWRGSGFKST